MPGGRPTKYDPSYCEGLIGHMGKGLSFESFAGVIEVSRDTLYEWAKVHPEFSDAKKIGTSKSLLKWEQIGFDGATGNNSNGIYYFNASSWIFTMKNRFKWKDKQDVTIQEVKPMVVHRRNGDVIELGMGRDETDETDESNES